MSIIRSDSIKNLAGTKEVSVNQLAGLIDTTIPNIEQDIADNTQGISDAMLSIENNKLRVLSVKWEPSRDIISVGDSACDGQLLSRSLYPDAWAAIDAGLVPVIDDATWLADPLQRGKFSRGDGTTTFRLPDYNGKQPGSIGAVFQRGDGALSAAVAGAIQRDSLQNITGELSGLYSSSSTPTGAFENSTYVVNPFGGATYGGLRTINFDASRVARTSTETRALNVTGVWVIRLFGSVVNVGLADAAQLASAHTELATRVTTLEARPFSKEFVSTQQTITSAGLLTLTHNLNATPKIVYSELVCVVAEHGFSIGDVCQFSFPSAATASNDSGVLYTNSSSINVRFGSATNPLLSTHKTSGAQVRLTSTSWRLVIRAWA